MFNLYLNNQQAYLPADADLTIVEENPFITKNGTYTLDITLPLAGCLANARIFSHIERFNVINKQPELSARLQTRPGISMIGRATVLELKDNQVTLQLLFDNSAFNLLLSDNTYIDELPLGMMPDHGLQGSYPQINCAQFALYNETDDSRSVNFYHPALGYIIERIFHTLGFTIARNDFKTSEFRRAFLVNTIVTDLLQDTLPHWSILKFIEELEKLFALQVVVKQSVVSLVFTSRYTQSESLVVLDQVIDSYQVAIDDSQTKPTLKNIGYKLTGPDIYDYCHLSDDTYNYYKKTTIQSMSTIADFIADTPNNPSRGRTIYIQRSSGRQYIAGDKSFGVGDPVYQPRQINQYRPLCQDPSRTELDVECEMIPAPVEPYFVFYPFACPNHGPSVQQFPVLTNIPVVKFPQFTELPDESTNKKTLEQIIQESQTPDKKRKNETFMLVFYNGVTQHTVTCEGYSYNIPIPILFSDDETICSFNLHALTNSIAALHTGGPKIDIREEWKIKALTGHDLDPQSVFQIKGRRFLCKQKEYHLSDTIDQEVEFTLHPIKTQF